MSNNIYDSYYNKFVSEGFSNKFASYYAHCIVDEMEHPDYDPEYGAWAHERGFLLSSAYAYGLNDDNYRDYLSDYDFYKAWPMNSWTRIWVDDKMTLKYMLQGTEFSDLMPEYYFYSTPNGLRELRDNPCKGRQDVNTFLEVLKIRKEMACKPNNGTGSMGFVHLTVDNQGTFFINKKRTDAEGIADFLNENPNYIFTEYLHPEAWFCSVNSLIHTLRVVVVNPHGNDPRIIGGYLRFGTANHGETNHMNTAEDSQSDFDFVTDVDYESGRLHSAKSIFFNKVIDTPNHPDSGVLADHMIPDWSKLKENILGISRYFFNCEFIGFDVGITGHGPKIMEINTHPGIKYVQVFHSFYEDSWTREWICSKIKKNK